MIIGFLTFLLYLFSLGHASGQDYIPPEGKFVIPNDYMRPTPLNYPEQPSLVKFPKTVTHFVNQPQPSRITQLAFSPDGGKLATAWEEGIQVLSLDREVIGNGKVCVWDISSRNALFQASLEDCVPGTLFFPPTHELVGTSWAGNILIHEIKTGKKRVQMKVPKGNVTSIQLCHDKRLLITASYSAPIHQNYTGALCIWDLSTGEIVKTIHSGEPVNAIALSPNDSMLAWCLLFSSVIHIWDLKKSVEVRTIQSEIGYIDSLTFSPDNDTLAVASRQQSRISFYNVSSRQISTRRGPHDHSPVVVAFSSSAPFLASLGEEGAVYLWNIGSSKSIRRIAGNNYSSMTFSPDGKRLALGKTNGVFVIKDITKD
jgi:WD40 repeat protein